MANNLTDQGIAKAVTQLGLWLLGLMFVALKLTGYIDWSWFWVTLPFWGGFALVAIILLGALASALLIGGFRLTGNAIYELKRKWKRRNR